MSRTILIMNIARHLLAGFLICAPFPALASPLQWALEFPKTNFSKNSIDLTEIKSAGAVRNSIPPIINPKFLPAKSISGLGPLEPVLRVEINGEVRGYPLRILLWHELVNDSIKDVPILITYCPLCSSGIVFERKVKGQVLVFGNTGRLRHYDLIMYDANSESWWQQFAGEAIVGAMTGTRLKPVVSRVQSFQTIVASDPDAKILVPADPKARDYGKTPYVRMDSSNEAADGFPYPIPNGIKPLDRVVVVGNEAWPLKRLRHENKIVTDKLVLTWAPGMNSIHDTRWIPFGRDIGNMRVQMKSDKGWVDAIHDTPFAFSFAAFHPKGAWHLQ